METKDLAFSVSAEWQRYSKENPWASVIPEEARDSEGHTFQRIVGKSVIYQQIEGGYMCVTCGSEIECVEVIHPIWEGPFACSGSGRTAKEIVPYCPKCEKEPSVYGVPIILSTQRIG